LVRPNLSPALLRKEVADCVAGVLIRGSTVLVEKRRADDEADPGLVMLPGGHVERNESIPEALKREMREELGIRIEKILPARIRYYTASNGERQRIHYFHVRNWNGKIESNEAETVYWESNVKNLSDETERKIVQQLIRQGSLP